MDPTGTGGELSRVGVMPTAVLLDEHIHASKEAAAGNGGVMIRDVSPADLTTITVTFGFSYRF